MRKVSIRSLKGKPSTDKRALAYVANNAYGIADCFNIPKWKLSYELCYPYLERNTPTVHPFFNQVGTRTGRLSCSNPNLLQIPKATDQWKTCAKDVYCQTGDALG